MEKDRDDNYSLYLHKWMGNPQPEGGDTLIPLELVMKAVKQPISPWEHFSIGVDPARYGNDESVICYREGFEIKPFLKFKGINTMKLSGMIINLAKELWAKKKDKVGAIQVKVDDTGIGAGVTDRLQEVAEIEGSKVDKKFHIKIVPVINNGTATNNDYYDYGAQMWGEMKQELETVKIPDDDELIQQLTTRKYKLHSDGRIRLESKDDMK